MDGVSFDLRENVLTIRDRADESALHWAVSLVLFAFVAAAGWAIVGATAREVIAHGLLSPGESGVAAYAAAIAALAIPVTVVGAIVLAWARPVFGGHEILQLTDAGFTLTNVDFGVRWRQRAFHYREVTGVDYVLAEGHDSGDIYAIQFRANRRRVRMFRYIAADAAVEVIGAMQARGARSAH